MATDAGAVPFERLMAGVVFALSGYENPLRAYTRLRARDGRPVPHRLDGRLHAPHVCMRHLLENVYL